MGLGEEGDNHIVRSVLLFMQKELSMKRSEEDGDKDSTTEFKVC